jgi:hypothetical protein
VDAYTPDSPADGVARDARHRGVRREHGLDHGNGWLLNHPLRKLLIFQTHVARGEAAEAA